MPSLSRFTRIVLAAGVAVTASLVSNAQSAFAAPIKVSELADSGAGSLRDAIDKANGSTGLDTIVFEPDLVGTITLTSGEIVITDDLIVDGSDAPNLTVSGNDTSRIFNVTAPAADLTIERMQLTAGFDPGAGGGAILAAGDVTIGSTVISLSNTPGTGGAVFAEGRVTVSASEIKANMGRIGGAIYAEEVVIENGSVIDANTAPFGGGGIYAESLFEVRNSTISNNVGSTATNPNYGGGGVKTFAEDVTIDDATFHNNESDGRSGGAIEVRNATVVITNSTFTQNTGVDGGAVAASRSALTVTNSAFDDNSATNRGGALDLQEGALTATSVNINVTAVAASARGFVTVFPCGEQPLAASLNYVPGVNGGNDLIAGLDADGGLCVFNLSETHLTIDVAGYTTL